MIKTSTVARTGSTASVHELVNRLS